MKIRTLTSSVLALVIVGVCCAQSSIGIQPQTGVVRHNLAGHHGNFNSAAVDALEADLTAARRAMSSALPIYEGHRAKSMEIVHRAIRIVDKREGEAVAPVKDHVHHTMARKKYSADQIAASQAEMNQGLGSLNQALTDLNAVAAGNKGKAVQNMSKLISAAIAQAQTAITLYNRP